MPEIQDNLGKSLLVLGSLFMLAGVFFLYGDKLPGLNRLGKLPLDIRIERENFKFYFPLGTSILVSILLTLFLRFFKGSGK